MGQKDDEKEDSKLRGFLASPRDGGKWSAAQSDGLISSHLRS
jgi:hypothetical protein